ncbi:hypothetical protein H4Q26_000714 [Puccinia striiformis f. sp. tritici PST-130]|nr:hypothetical protein H4Q26_000714 [Puccinia striiformis f. sp. tritici PST-130]
MRGLQICKIVFGILVSFHHSIAADAPPSVGIPSSVSPCGAVPLEITGGTPPYSIAINAADNPSGPHYTPSQTSNNHPALPGPLASPSYRRPIVRNRLEPVPRKTLQISRPPARLVEMDPPKTGRRGCRLLARTKTAGGPTPPASANSTDPAHPANAVSTTANATGAVRLDSADSNNASMPDSANATATADQHGVMNMTDSTPMSPSTARATNMPPSNKTVNHNDNSKSGNNTSSVNNRPNPARSEASRRQLGPLYLSLFITTLAGILINR